MAGYTKYIHLKDIEKVKTECCSYIKSIKPILPKDYNFESIIGLIERFYPYEWNIINEKYEYYCIKEKHLISKGKKSRYSMKEPKEIVKALKITKEVLSKNYRKKHYSNFEKKIQEEKERILIEIRFPKINNIKMKIDKSKLKTQEMEPVYLDKLMGLYDKKKTKQMDKVYILKELEKYYCEKIISFFRKKVDTEYNRQLREMSFYHLQGLKHYVAPLRRQKYMIIPSKNKKRRLELKKYAKEIYNISEIPKELEYRIDNSKEQKLKEYDFFISHSSDNFDEVQKIIKVLNQKNKDVYCDWINDTDYLKRHLVGDATKKVIEKRLEQSKNILLIRSDSAKQSNWVKYELNYFNSLGKKIFVLDKEDISNKKYEYKQIEEKWFYDENYKNLELY